MVRFLLENKDELEEKKVLAVITAGKNPSGYAKRVKTHFRNLGILNIHRFLMFGF